MGYMNVLLNLKSKTINVFAKMPHKVETGVQTLASWHYPLKPGYNNISDEDLEILKGCKAFQKLLQEPDIYLNDAKANVRYQNEVDALKENNAEYKELMKKRELERPQQEAQAKIAELERRLAEVEKKKGKKADAEQPEQGAAQPAA